MIPPIKEGTVQLEALCQLQHMRGRESGINKGTVPDSARQVVQGTGVVEGEAGSEAGTRRGQALLRTFMS